MRQPVFALVWALVIPGALAAQRDATVDDFLGITRCDGGQAVTVVRGDLREGIDAVV